MPKKAIPSGKFYQNTYWNRQSLKYRVNQSAMRLLQVNSAISCVVLHIQQSSPPFIYNAFYRLIQPYPALFYRYGMSDDYKSALRLKLP